MGDLISRSALIKSLNIEDGGTPLIALQLNSLYKEIMNQPTAYDKEKVVEQLEEIKSKNSFFGSDHLIDRAIEIVEKGGAE